MKDENFLTTFFIEQKKDLTWRRDIEFRLLQYIFAFYPIILVAITTLYNSKIDSDAFMLLSIGFCVLLFLITTAISYNIYHQHKIQKEIANDILKVYQYFELFEAGVYLKDSILPTKLKDSQNGFGAGKGFRQIVLIIWIIYLIVSATVIYLGINKS